MKHLLTTTLALACLACPAAKPFDAQCHRTLTEAEAALAKSVETSERCIQTVQECMVELRATHEACVK